MNAGVEPRIRQRPLPTSGHERRLDPSEVAGFVAVAVIEDAAVLVEHDRVLKKAAAAQPGSEPPSGMSC